MIKAKFCLIIVLLVVIQFVSFAQNSTNSPYSLYGYGKLAEQSFGAQRSLGGIGYGLRDSKTINSLNPAAFSSIDSLTFLLDMGVSYEMARFDDGSNHSSKSNGTFEYVALQLPLSKHVGLGLGFKPVSYVGYRFGETTDESTKTYYGSGGLNQFFGALSYNLGNFSIGANVSYLFGTIRHNVQVTFTDATTYPSVTADTLRMSGLNLDFGVQYVYPLAKDKQLIFGAVYTPKMSINGNYSGHEITYGSNVSYTKLQSKKNGYDTPETFGVGVTYVLVNKFLAGFDYTLQKWKDVEFEGKNNAFNNRNKYNAGFEFTPAARSRNFLERVKYRIGANYSDSYVSALSVLDNNGSHKYKELGLTAGFGLPLFGGRSNLNIGFEYIKTTPETKNIGLIDEQYYKFTVSYTFNELWFFQRKVQ